MRILVLCGGASSERVVSLASGDAVAKWCAALGHEVLKYDPERPGDYFAADHAIAPAAIGLAAPELQGHGGFDPRVIRGLLDAIERHSIDVVFPILHGGYGEDGTLQSLLEWANVSYVGSGPRSCAMAMHKPTTKIVLGHHGVPVPRGFTVEFDELRDAARIGDRIAREVGYPAIVKPQSGGSTVGLTLLDTSAQLPSALDKIRQQQDGALIESCFKGHEIAATVIDGAAYPLIEIRPKSGIYDYSNKYTAGRTEYICPAPLPEATTLAVQRCAEKAFAALEARGFARVDFLVNDSDFVCLELNSLPGMTATSLVPKAAMARGMNAEQMVSKFLATTWHPALPTKA
ncbi:MAG: D-alanine--D-alanine ligase [bacterium]|nr:D-alanine--D-alanine ligase [bacterium]